MEWINTWGKAAGSIVTILGLISLILVKPVKGYLNARKKEAEAVREFQETVLAKLDAINDDIADLQYERLAQAHDFYMGQGWCPTSEKQMLCQMYKSYHGKGRNHLSEHYEQDIVSLRDKP